MKRSALFVLVLISMSMLDMWVHAASTGGQAAVKLVNASATISQTSDTYWTLKKTGEVDTSRQMVSWTIKIRKELLAKRKCHGAL